jgi:LacI family repressor for deo operon, udp, cdd, tsx, nupC, and nupG
MYTITLNARINVLTISQVAELAGVSVATISRVLNDSPLVTEKTKRHVQEVIKAHDYHPNVVARSLRSSRSNMMLALVPHISNPFYSTIVQGINEVAHAHDYNLLLCETNTLRSREDVFFSMLKQKTVDGIISLDPAVSRDNLIEYGAKYPVIQCCEYQEALDVPYVTIDNEQAAFDAVSDLLATGCRRIALVNAAGTFGYARMRREGYLRALREQGVGVDPALMFEYRIGEDSGAEVARRLLDLKPLPDGVFFVSDVIAVGAQRALIDAGVRVPEDVAVFGFDDIDMARICTPMLTTVAQPMALIGRKAAEMLFTLVDGKELEERRVVLDYAIKKRQSTR